MTFTVKNPLPRIYDYKSAKKIRSVFGAEKINALQSSCGWQERYRILDIDSFMWLFIGGRTSPQSSLTQMCQELFTRGVVISKQSLNERINEKAAHFMQLLLGEVLQLQFCQSESDLLAKCFSSIKITDATSFQLPANLYYAYKGSGGGASVSGVKTHYQFDITSGEMNFEILNGASSDTSSTIIDPRPGELHLFDMGYFKYSLLEKIASANAYYLSRLRFSTPVFYQTSEGLKRLDWATKIKQLTTNKPIELEVFLGKQQQVKTRLIIEKVPKEIADQKRRKLKSHKINKRKAISKERLAFCDVNVLVTNAPKEALETSNVQSIYSLRWQIEILFKTWKSFLNIDKIQRMNLNRFKCHHYGTLIYILLTGRIFFHSKLMMWKKQKTELSELKAIKFIAESKDIIRDILTAKTKRARDSLEKLIQNIQTNCKKEAKGKKKTPFQIILMTLT